jgi:tripartite-type tricarboxylate transporter receptor subunit TctC
MQKTIPSLAIAVAVVAAGIVPPGAGAQPAFPSQPVRIVLATPAGGASDTAARLLAQSLAKRLGQQVLVENRPGGNGVPAVQAVLGAAPDGHTLLWAQSSMAGMPILVRSAPVKSMAEFAPIAPVVDLVYGLFVNPQVPAATVAELGAHLRANPDRLSYATGVLSEYMITVAWLDAIGARAVRVPYKGGSQLMPNLVAGEVQFNFGPLAPGLPHVRSGKLRLLATLPERVEGLAGVPALKDAGVAIGQLPTWNGLVAPPATPAALTERIAREVNQVLAEPAVRTALEAQGFRVTGGGPRQMAEAVELATNTWRRFVRDHDIPQE